MSNLSSNLLEIKSKLVIFLYKYLTYKYDRNMYKFFMINVFANC